MSSRSSFHRQLGIHWLTVSQTYQQQQLPLCTCCVFHWNLVPTVRVDNLLLLRHSSWTSLPNPRGLADWQDHLTSPPLVSVTPLDSFFSALHVFYLLFYIVCLYYSIIILHIILHVCLYYYSISIFFSISVKKITSLTMISTYLVYLLWSMGRKQSWAIRDLQI